ncbi:hypothetical protein BDV25DRAFT_153526 [Aspergillus avenaceus]|uniref:Uncharacterized protein n=1 Tax=Aspergillus avenaceus TaxID=36643 RepID=A0A5N6TX03_ASPAV|nr:hypothetical protein BDV25DRAFT_153526 [Aspergillus avenaceus]
MSSCACIECRGLCRCCQRLKAFRCIPEPLPHTGVLNARLACVMGIPPQEDDSQRRLGLFYGGQRLPVSGRRHGF